jgi:hypothetical protein
MVIGGTHLIMTEPTPAQRAIGDFAPKFVDLTDGILFGDVWERTELPKRDRSLITVASLINSSSFVLPAVALRDRVHLLLPEPVLAHPVRFGCSGNHGTFRDRQKEKCQSEVACRAIPEYSSHRAAQRDANEPARHRQGPMNQERRKSSPDSSTHHF